MKCLLELYFKNSDIDANNFLLNKLISSINKYLKLKNIEHGVSLEGYITPERVVILLNLNDVIRYSKKGIKLSDKKEHLEYFLKKENVPSIDNLLIKNNRYYYEFDLNPSKFIKDLIFNIDNILRYSFIKNYKKLILSLENIYLNIDNRPEKIIFNNIKSENYVIICKKKINVKFIDDYFNLLEKNKIFLKKDERKDFVKKNLPIINENFIENVLFIKEKPLFLYGKIKFNCDELYIKILENISKNKYTFFIKDEFLYFIFLSENGFEKIESFNKELNNDEILNNKIKIEKIIYKVNNKIKLYDKNKKSKEYKFIFNENRLDRLSKTTKFLSIWIPNCNMDEIDNILSSPIYKNSNFLENNTKLNLLIKKYFLVNNNKNEKFINTVIDSLKPLKDDNDMPIIPESVAISISNKIDTIIYINILSELKKSINKNIERKLYNDLLNIILFNNINIPLKIIINYSIKNFINETIRKKQDRIIIKKYKINKDLIVNNIIEKIYNKLYYHLINVDNLNEEIVNNLISIETHKDNINILDVYNKVKAIVKYFEKNDIKYFFKTYKRLNNLINKKIIINNFSVIFKPKRFNSIYERNIYNSYFKLKENKKKSNNKIDYSLIMENLFELSKYLNDFLDNVYINKTNIFKRKKYIKLLSSIKTLYKNIIDFEILI